MKKILLSGFLTVTICILLLFITAFIPQKAIQKNMEKSAEYFNNHELFDHVTDNVFLSRQDNYADCILTNIIYHIDQDDLLHSVISAPYFKSDGESVNDSFSYAVKNNVEPNVDYSRYWHGSMVILRPLFCIFDIAKIRILLGVVILTMTIWFEYLLIKNHYTLLGICYVLGLLSVSIWMCAFCIEYAMPFLIMTGGLPILFIGLTKKVKSSVKLDCKQNDLDVYLLCTLGVFGILTAFTDFLTTETITFTAPYFIYLIVKEKNNRLADLKKEVFFFVKSFLIWGLSYAFMMLLKWLAAFFVLGKTAFVDALQQAMFRMSGDATLGNIADAEVVSSYERITGALFRNIGCLYPFKDIFSMKTVYIFIAIVGILVFVNWHLFRTTQRNCLNKMCIMLVLIPYIRFLMLNNHSYIHFFFTYRAQLIVVVILFYIEISRIITYRKKNKL